MPAIHRLPDLHLNRREELLFGVLVLFVASVYFATFIGITSSNDGSHYALVRAIVDHRRFEISDYLAFTENQDYAINGDLRFSDRPPGTALWAAPWFALGTWLPTPQTLPPSKHDSGNPLILGIGAATALAGALAVGVFWRLLRHYFGLSRFSSTFTALALAFGSVLWKYGSVLYSHSLAALVILGALYLGLWLVRWQTLPPLTGFAFGFFLGYTLLTEYTNALYVLAVALFVGGGLWQATLAGLRSPDSRTAWLLGWGALILGGLLPILFLLGYNTLNFGGPLTLSRTQVDLVRWPENENFATSFATPIGLGLRGMLFYSPENMNQGLLLLSPIAWLSLAGLPLGWQHVRRRADLLFSVGVFVLFLLLFSASTTYNPYTNDGRYLTPFLPLWWLPLAFWVEFAYRRLEGDLPQLAGGLLLFGTLAISVRNVAVHIAVSWNYDLKFSELLNMSTPLPNLERILGVLFPNVGNLWWLWLALLPAVGLWWWWVVTHAEQ